MLKYSYIINLLMETKKIIWIISIIVVAVLAAYLSIMLFLPSQPPSKELIGGQRDEHGCLGPAGYSFDEEIDACVRSWELNDTVKREAAIKAVEQIGPRDSLTIVSVTETEQGFEVELSDDTYEVFTVDISSG